MPIFSYIAVVGSALMAALFVASASLHPVEPPFHERDDVVAFLKYKAHVGNIPEIRVGMPE